MIRIIGRTVRFFVGVLALVSFLALIGVLALWRDSKETLHMARYGGEKGYYDIAFNQGRVQVTGIRRSVRELSPHWLTRPVPSQPMMTANPLVMWDFSTPEKVVWESKSEQPARIVYRKGLAQWSATGADDEELTEPRTGHAVIMPAWVAAAALAVLPALWLLVKIPARALRRRKERRVAAEHPEAEGSMATA